MPPRSNVNGTLLQTLNLPKLQFLSAKEDLYFTTTKQVSKEYILLSLILTSNSRDTIYERTVKWSRCPSSVIPPLNVISTRYLGICCSVLVALDKKFDSKISIYLFDPIFRDFENNTIKYGNIYYKSTITVL